jgi:hypothetical protein
LASAEPLPTDEGGKMMEAPAVNGPVSEPKTLRLAALRPSRLQDPMLDTLVKNSPIPIYV